MNDMLSAKNVIRIVLLVLCGLILGLNIYSFNANSLIGNKLPMPFGYGAAVVLSGSMEPELSTGDLIIVKELESYQYSVNEVVVFQDPASLVVHRIVQKDGKMLVTKGDANDAFDEPINVSDVKGKVIFKLPFVGTIINFLKTPVGTALIIIAAILLLEIPRRRERKHDEDERQKIIDEIRKLKDEMK